MEIDDTNQRIFREIQEHVTEQGEAPGLATGGDSLSSLGIDSYSVLSILSNIDSRLIEWLLKNKAFGDKIHGMEGMNVDEFIKAVKDELERHAQSE